VEQADVRIDALHDFTVKLKNQPKNAMSGRMLRPEVNRVIRDAYLAITWINMRTAYAISQKMLPMP
jgi:hypothetical protein